MTNYRIRDDIGFAVRFISEIEPELIKRLKLAGFSSIENLAIRSPADIAKLIELGQQLFVDFSKLTLGQLKGLGSIF